MSRQPVEIAAADDELSCRSYPNQRTLNSRALIGQYRYIVPEISTIFPVDPGLRSASPMPYREFLSALHPYSDDGICNRPAEGSAPQNLDRTVLVDRLDQQELSLLENGRPWYLSRLGEVMDGSWLQIGSRQCNSTSSFTSAPARKARLKFMILAYGWFDGSSY
ncbi:hypothetical protein MKZ38_010684 [Zalerion maritima]|uniref:Uncharacterized protein n=1 Tax=Zalerion maritima TaxID=339359 RepID=A0AAD5WUB7_9PEZI|nr:hypothetical protein MKZ38_010684 [Zalerion maritima]